LTTEAIGSRFSKLKTTRETILSNFISKTKNEYVRIEKHKFLSIRMFNKRIDSRNRLHNHLHHHLHYQFLFLPGRFTRNIWETESTRLFLQLDQNLKAHHLSRSSKLR
jgi:hypothetical protein